MRLLPYLYPVCINILIYPLQFFRFTFCKQYKRRKVIRVELATILPIRSRVVGTGKLFVNGLKENPK